jgi:hypothetical protein
MSRRSVAGGIGVVVAFLALTWLSGSWSPLARGPVLDGLGPLAPYRWVSPPPEAAANQPPLTGTFQLGLDREGSEPDVLVTPDDQVTLILDRGAIGPAPGRRSVGIVVTPLDPATLGALPGGLSPFGNAIRIDAAGVAAFDGQVDVILLYPATNTLHATRHEVLWSADGAAWRPLDTTDTLATQQAQATLDAPGYVVVGAVPVPHPSGSRPQDGGGTGTTASVAIVVVGAAALLAVALAARIAARRRAGR